MNIRQTLQNSVRSLFVNKGRCLQAILGMVIGIAGFVFAWTANNISLMDLQIQQDEYAPTLMQTWTYVSVDLPMKVMPSDMEQLAQDNREIISGISPYVEFDLPGGVRYGERTKDDARVYGVNSSYLDMVPVLRLHEGRFLEYMDISRERNVCVIGHSIANDLMEGNALGQTLKIWGENYTVIGVFADVQNDIIPIRNNEVYIPYTNARKINGESISSYGNYNDKYFVCANGKENMYKTQVLIKEMLCERTRREENNGWILQVYSIGDTSEMVRGYILGDAIHWSFFSGIVLLVGGVGIMNVMLAGVQARTKEIGIRKAFGATNRNIQQQFALEAVITGLIGGLLGVLSGFFVVLFLILWTQSSFSYLYAAIWPVLVAVVITILIGWAFGTYPAKQAAKMEIVDAINSD